MISSRHLLNPLKRWKSRSQGKTLDSCPRIVLLIGLPLMDLCYKNLSHQCSSNGLPRFWEPFVLHTDASKDGLGAVLYQYQNDVLRVTAYGSRTLTPAERNYHLHSGKLEFLALKWEVRDQFRDYLYYALSFQVHTDNNPLTYVLFTAKLITTGLSGNNSLTYVLSTAKRNATGLSGYCG